MNRLISRLIVLLLVPCLVAEPMTVLAMGTVGAGFHPRPQSGWNEIAGRHGGLPLQFYFTSQALAPGAVAARFGSGTPDKARETLILREEDEQRKAMWLTFVEVLNDLRHPQYVESGKSGALFDLERDSDNRENRVPGQPLERIPSMEFNGKRAYIAAAGRFLWRELDRDELLYSPGYGICTAMVVRGRNQAGRLVTGLAHFRPSVSSPYRFLPKPTAFQQFLKVLDYLTDQKWSEVTIHLNLRGQALEMPSKEEINREVNDRGFKMSEPVLRARLEMADVIAGNSVVHRIVFPRILRDKTVSLKEFDWNDGMESGEVVVTPAGPTGRHFTATPRTWWQRLQDRYFQAEPWLGIWLFATLLDWHTEDGDFHHSTIFRIVREAVTLVSLAFMAWRIRQREKSAALKGAA